MIYVITHKKYEDKKYNRTGYNSLLVGNKSIGSNAYISDSNGDNISWKNSNYSELTGMYWIWKNIGDDYVGICHYRRFFTQAYYSDQPKYFIDEEDVMTTLSEYDIILPYKVKISETNNVYEHYALNHIGNDLDKVEEIIADYHPDYIESFNQVMSGNQLYLCNMAIMKKEKYDEYCNWLFSILFEVEKRIDISEYNNYQKRIFGFLSERLFAVWIANNDLLIKEEKVCYLRERKIL